MCWYIDNLYGLSIYRTPHDGDESGSNFCLHFHGLAGNWIVGSLGRSSCAHVEKVRRWHLLHLERVGGGAEGVHGALQSVPSNHQDHLNLTTTSTRGPSTSWTFTYGLTATDTSRLTYIRSQVKFCPAALPYLLQPSSLPTGWEDSAASLASPLTRRKTTLEEEGKKLCQTPFLWFFLLNMIWITYTILLYVLIMRHHVQNSISCRPAQLAGLPRNLIWSRIISS